MRVAIVEDLPADQTALREGILRWGKERGIPLAPPPALFSRGETLLDGFSGGRYDVVFLDIYLPGITGMETARRLRAADPVCRIIFTTSSDDFAVESYEVDSTYYLVKPYTQRQLWAALDRCGASLLEREQFLILPGPAGEQRLYLHQVVYTEYGNRRIQVHLLTGEELSVSMSQRDFSALLLPYPYFCDCIKGVLVNLEAVDKLLEDRFLLRGGVSIPISRLKYREVREQFLRFSYARVRGELR